MTSRKLVSGSNLVLSLLLLWGVWVALPARWWLVDGLGSALSLLCGAAGFGLMLDKPWAPRIARIACWAVLVIGTLTVSTLAFVVAHLAGLYGPVGKGGALLMTTIAVLVLPYLVGLPLVQFMWLRGGERQPEKGDA